MVLFVLLLYYFQVCLCVLVSVAFLTLLERKILSYFQMRKGPNKLGWVGIMQPFSDALKLFSKEESLFLMSNKKFYWFSPVFGFITTFLVWFLVVSQTGFVDLKLSFFFFLVCVGVAIYGIIFSGWSANSKYSLLGGLRAVAQTVSYEIVISLIFFCLVFFSVSLNISVVLGVQKVFGFVFFFPLFVLFFICCVAEANRAPFDLAEGESELVSGFNIDYGGMKFALIFLAEYASILWLSLFCSILFCGKGFFFCSMGFMCLFLILRAAFPRIRYDDLMYLTWKKMLPVVLLFYVFIFSF